MTDMLMTDQRPRQTLMALTVLTVVLLLPFINKAYHIDDPVFLRMARQIMSHPLDPYGSTVNWYGSEQPMFTVMDNPPATAYYIAAVASLSGWSERVLHLAFLPFAVAAVLGTAVLARRAGAPPVVAAVACLCSPLFLVSSTNVMCDTMMASLFVWSLVLWVDGIDRASYPLLLGAVALAALGALTKYFAICAVPLMATYALARNRRWTGQLLLLALPLAVLAGFDLWTSWLYGRGMVTGAAGAANRLRWYGSGPAWTKGIIGVSFAGGAVPAAFFLVHRLVPRLQLLGGAVLGIIGVLVLLTLPDGPVAHLEPGARMVLLGELFLLIASGYTLLAITASSTRSPLDPMIVTLQLWVGGTLLFCSFVNWTINGPPMMLLVPPAAILFARRLRVRGPAPVAGTGAALLGAALLSLAVCWGDYCLASAGRKAAEQVMSIPRPNTATVWFQGHWGFQYYMEERGAKAVDRYASMPQAGDIIVVPTNNTGVFGMQQEYVAAQQSIDVPASGWVTTINGKMQAGFYHYLYGPVPFVFGSIPPERYHLALFGTAEAPSGAAGGPSLTRGR